MKCHQSPAASTVALFTVESHEQAIRAVQKQNQPSRIHLGFCEGANAPSLVVSEVLLVSSLQL